MKKLVSLLLTSILCVSSLTVYAVSSKTSIYSVSEILSLVSKSYSGEIIKLDLEVDDNKKVYYEVDILDSGKKTELIVDAKTGKVVKAFEEALDNEEKYIADNFTQDSSLKIATAPITALAPSKEIDVTKALITEEEAKKIALDRVGGGRVIKCKLDRDDGVMEYEIEILFGKYEYEIDIDANTGIIVDYDRDHIYD